MTWLAKCGPLGNFQYDGKVLVPNTKKSRWLLSPAVIVWSSGRWWCCKWDQTITMVYPITLNLLQCFLESWWKLPINLVYLVKSYNWVTTLVELDLFSNCRFSKIKPLKKIPLSITSLNICLIKSIFIISLLIKYFLILCLFLSLLIKFFIIIHFSLPFIVIHFSL